MNIRSTKNSELAPKPSFKVDHWKPSRITKLHAEYKLQEKWDSATSEQRIKEPITYLGLCFRLCLTDELAKSWSKMIKDLQKGKRVNLKCLSKEWQI